ncbi:MAG: transcriptional regulator [Oscillatoriales cyanobacterium]|nr:MAG: transcriptional regulator [Oscillatoriales cyanobacterium]
MERSSRVEYALLALLELATPYPKDSPLTVSEIAAAQEIPERYLDQILTVLRRAGFVQSLRGAKGGYLLAKKQEVTAASLTVLGKYTLQDLCQQRDDRKQVNPMYYI